MFVDGKSVESCRIFLVDGQFARDFRIVLSNLKVCIMDLQMHLLHVSTPFPPPRKPQSRYSNLQLFVALSGLSIPIHDIYQASLRSLPLSTPTGNE